MMKNGKNLNKWIRTTALTVAAALTFTGTATTFAQSADINMIDTTMTAAYSITLPALSVMTVDRSMKLAEEALQKMEAAKDTGKNESKENSKPSSKPSSSASSSKPSTSSKPSSSASSSKPATSSKPSSSASSSKPATSSKPSSSASSSKPATSSKPSSASSSKPSSSSGTTALKNNGCEIDTSKASSGTIRVRQNGSTTKVKVLVYFNGSSKYYQYTIPTNNTWTSIPLQSGSGTYKVRFMKQVSGTSYTQMYSVTFQVGMQNANSAYLNPSQYVVYNSSSACVTKAKSLVAGAGSDAQKVSRIYSYIVNNISYDYNKMNNLPSGYLPNPDSTLSSRKGICFDYAALMAAMLRSQGIPCKLVIGNADGAYHAWNMVYVNGSWQLYDATYGAAGQRASSYVAQRVY